VTILEVMCTNKSVNALWMNAQIKRGHKNDILKCRWCLVTVEIIVVPSHRRDRDDISVHCNMCSRERFREEKSENLRNW